MTAAAASVTGAGAGDVRPSTRARSAAHPPAVAWAGVCALIALAPFEAIRPLFIVAGQSVSTVEALLAGVLIAWLGAHLRAGTRPRWRTPLTVPWLAFLAAMIVAAAASDARGNALNMAGRVGLALLVFLLAVDGLASRDRLRRLPAVAAAAGLFLSALVLAEFADVGRLAAWLSPFRENVAVVGGQLRASGPFQYPTIASMYLEVTFALAVILVPLSIDGGRSWRAAAAAAALLVMAAAIVFTFTRAGLITMMTTLAIAIALRCHRHGADRAVRTLAVLALLVIAIFFGSRSSEAVRLRLTSEGTDAWFRAEVAAPLELSIRPGEVVTVPVAVTNRGRRSWDGAGDQPFRFSYHWLHETDDLVVSWEGLRSTFTERVAPGRTVQLAARVEAPGEPGRYRILWDVEQQHRLWFSTEPGASLSVSRAIVAGPRVGAGAALRPTPMPKPASRPGRLVLWRAAGRMFAASPLVGVGPDNFRLFYGGYAGLANPDARVHSNNMYLEILAGGGLLAGTAFAWLFWRSLACLARALRRSCGPLMPALAAGAAAALAAIAVHGLVDSFLSFTATYVLFAIALGFAVCSATLSATPEPKPLDSDAHRI